MYISLLENYFHLFAVMAFTIPLSFNHNLQKERDSATERAKELQKQLSDLHKDHEKLRKGQVMDLNERVCGWLTYIALRDCSLFMVVTPIDRDF